MPESGPPSPDNPGAPGPPPIPFTPDQRAAIETIDRSVLVSAAAGAGKTAVLAERCASLVCDAPAEQRCGLDQLLVVTFTENAAAEMKARIRRAIQDRLRREPGNARLREQLALIDVARISTLHAFGLWVLRRGFNEAGIDPAAPVLDEHETLLLATETLDQVFERLYAEASAEGEAFRDLIERYGPGGDRGIRRFVLRLARFLDSLPEPQQWLDRALARVTHDRHELLRGLAVMLAEELEGQIEYCQRAADYVSSKVPEFSFYARRLEEAAAQLSDWRLILGDPRGEVELRDRLGRVQSAMAGHKFSVRGAPSVAAEASEEIHQKRDRARTLWERFNDKMFKTRLQRIVARYSPAEWFEGLDRVAPYVQTVVQLTESYRKAYAATKAADGVLDFADLERKTYELLTKDPAFAADLRARFRYVLVDEFQDTNPLQEAILRGVSREGEPRGQHAPPVIMDGGDKPRRSFTAGNLFVVGDVKQSIYRFRLAEPEIFLKRQHSLRDGGGVLSLQENFRSEGHILEAVNLLFRRLMVEKVGGITYDDSAELRSGRASGERGRPGEELDVAIIDSTPHSALRTPHSVEVHLLQRKWSTSGGGAAAHVDPDDPAEWTAIEREAWLIAARIRGLIQQGARKRDGSAITYRDVTVLLRAVAHTAAPLARMLSACGVPARADVGGEFFTAVEVQDVLSLLAVLDNAQQDIPLAAVLRAGILGETYNEDDLLALRLLDRTVPFHDAVRRYPDEGTDPDLRKRIAATLERVERWRDEARQRPLADTLWRIYQAHSYLAWVGGLPNAAARRANLLKLHELARKFGTFQRQGLYRFLRFLDALREQDVDLGSAAPSSAADDVVRVMNIHRSKGLEFPVVVLADLGRRFNVEDAFGSLIYDRDMGLGVRVVDPQRMIEYPTLAHFLAADRIHLHTRAEELRVLYVALTRAMQHLILVGSGDLESFRLDYALHAGTVGPLSPLAIRTAATPLSWLIPAWASMPRGKVEWKRDRGTEGPRDRMGGSMASPPYEGGAGGDNSRLTAPQPAFGVVQASSSGAFTHSLFVVRTYDEETMQGWSLQETEAEPERQTRKAVARLAALPGHEPTGAPSDVVNRIMDRLDYVYPHLEDASVPAVVAATELAKGRLWLIDPEELIADCGLRIAESEPEARAPGSFAATRRGALSRESAMATGIATHRFMQHLDFPAVAKAGGLQAELQRITGAGVLTQEEAGVVELDAIAWFLTTDLGRRLHHAGNDYHRELMFLSKFRRGPCGGDAASASASPAFSLVRGVIDGVLRSPAGLEIIDYKTDRIDSSEIAARAEYYGPQVRAYASAAEGLFRQPVTAKWLVFLHPRQVVEIGKSRPPCGI